MLKDSMTDVAAVAADQGGSLKPQISLADHSEYETIYSLLMTFNWQVLLHCETCYYHDLWSRLWFVIQYDPKRVTEPINSSQHVHRGHGREVFFHRLLQDQSLFLQPHLSPSGGLQVERRLKACQRWLRFSDLEVASVLFNVHTISEQSVSITLIIQIIINKHLLLLACWSKLVNIVHSVFGLNKYFRKSSVRQL